MGKLKGTFAVTSIAIWTVCVCIPLYIMGFMRAFTPASLRPRWAGPMDCIIDLWVSWNILLVKLLDIVEVELTLPDSLQDRNRWFVVVSNHQSWADILILQNVFRHRLPVLKFFTKRELIWVPFVGPAMWMLGFPYVRRFSSSDSKTDASRRARNVETLQSTGKRFFDRPVAALSFLEGTRFTPAKQQDQESPYTFLLNPRTGGVGFVLDLFDELPFGVVDVTLVYEGKVPGFFEFLCGECPRVVADVQLVEPPANDYEAVKTWVDDLWREKDLRISGVQERLS